MSEAQGYHPNNLKLQPYDHEKLIELIGHAVRLGIQFHVGGIPFGAPYNRELWEGFNVESSFPRAQGDGDQAHAPEQGSAQLGGPPGAIVGGSEGQQREGEVIVRALLSAHDILSRVADATPIKDRAAVREVQAQITKLIPE